LEENFIPQKCSKHENKKLDLFCVKDEVKCCSLCLTSDHKFHDVIPISETANYYKSKILEVVDFQKIYSTFEEEMKEMDKEISFKKKELSDLENKKQQKIDIFESVQKISNSIKKEQNVEKIMQWNLFLEEKVLYEYKLLACGHNGFGDIGMGDKRKNSSFTEIPQFHNKKIDLISCGTFHSFVYCGKILFIIIQGCKLYGTGLNNNGQLGIGIDQGQKEFISIDFFTNLEISKISCGFDHTFVQLSILTIS
jgi:alpha-tubulin suppressor-like RCC1 family protein